MVSEHVIGVAGYVNCLNMRRHRSQALSQLAAVEQGHHHVGHQKVDRTRFMFPLMQRIGPIGRLENTITRAGEGFPQHLSHLSFVLHQQDCLATAMETLCYGLCCREGCRFVKLRQVNKELSAPAALATHDDATSVLAYASIHTG